MKKRCKKKNLLIFIMIILLLFLALISLKKTPTGDVIKSLFPYHYKLSTAYIENTPYLDYDSVIITSLPAELNGATLIKTRVRDRARNIQISFRSNKKSTVYVAGWEDAWGNQKPSWLTGYSLANEDIETNFDDNLLIYKKDFAPGKIKLGPCGKTCKDSLMYFVIVKEKCTEKWSCSSWSACSNNLQTKTCTDLNKCGTTENKPGTSQSCSGGGKLLFFSSWNGQSGNCGSSQNKGPCTDANKWTYEWNTAPIQYPSISAGGPNGNNFMNMATAGGGVHGSNPYYINWFIRGDDVFHNPDDLYIGTYFRVHQDWVNNLHNSNHWFIGIDNPSSKITNHYLRFEAKPDESDFSDIKSKWVLGTGINALDEVFKLHVSMEPERWYYFEINVKKINSTSERWFFRLDGADVTNKFMCISDGCYRKWFGELYSNGFSWDRRYHGNLWLTTYDEITLNRGWDVAGIEVRSDGWPRDLN